MFDVILFVTQRGLPDATRINFFFFSFYLTKISQKEYPLLNKLPVLLCFDVILFVLFDQCETTTDILFKELYGRNKIRLF